MKPEMGQMKMMYPVDPVRKRRKVSTDSMCRSACAVPARARFTDCRTSPISIFVALAARDKIRKMMLRKPHARQAVIQTGAELSAENAGDAPFCRDRAPCQRVGPQNHMVMQIALIME